MARKFGNNVEKVTRGKKISKMNLSEVKTRLDLYKRFESSKYYQHLEARFNILTS